MVRCIQRRRAFVAFLAIALLSIFVAPQVAHASVVSPTSVADATVKESSPTSNFGSDTSIKTQNVFNSGSTEYRSYLKFDLSAYSGTLNSATLKLMPSTTSGSGSAVHAVSSSSWTETGGGSITWNNQPGVGSQIATTGAITSGTLKSITVTSGVALGQNVTLALVGLSSSDISYHSKENTTDPVLEVDYNPAATPTVVTGNATSVGLTTATLNGTVNPNNASATYHFEYGPTTSYGTNIPVPDDSAGSGGSAVPVNINLTGLTQNTTYHYRLTATNGQGSASGSDQTFTTNLTSFPKCIWTSGSDSGLTDAELDTIKSLGFDCVQANPDINVLDRVAAKGLVAAVWLGNYRDYNDSSPTCVFNTNDTTLTSQVNAVKNHSATAYYFIADEPHIGTCTNSPTQMADRHALIRSLDSNTNHKTLITENQTVAYSALADTTDVMGLVAYPCNFNNGCASTTIQDKINAATSAGVDEYWSMPQILEDTGGSPYYEMPTASELFTLYGWWDTYGTGAETGEMTFLWDGCSSCDGLGNQAAHSDLNSTVATHNGV